MNSLLKKQVSVVVHGMRLIHRNALKNVHLAGCRYRWLCPRKKRFSTTHNGVACEPFSPASFPTVSSHGNFGHVSMRFCVVLFHLVVVHSYPDAGFWNLNVVKNGASEVTGVFWERAGISIPAVDAKLLAIIAGNPALMKHSASINHAVYSIPFGTPGFPMGDLVVLLGGQTTAIHSSAFIGQEPIDVGLHPKGVFVALLKGTRVSVEFYDVAEKKWEVFPVDVEASEYGKKHKIEFRDGEFILISGTQRLSFFPGQKKGTMVQVFTELAEGNLKVIEHEFGARDLGRQALEGSLDPDVTEEERVSEIARVFEHNRLQRNVLVWGEGGNNIKGIVHLFAHKVAEKKFQYFEGWKIYELNWSRLNTEGLVDKAVEKATRLMEALSGKKVILYVPQFENLIGLGVDNHSTGGRGDVSSVFVSYVNSGRVLILASTSSNYIGDIQNKGDLFGEFTVYQIIQPMGDELLAKLKKKAEMKLEQTGVKFSEDNLKTIIDLTDKYLPEKRQPGKSYDAMDALVTKLRHQKPDNSGKMSLVGVTEDHIRNYVAETARIPTIAGDFSRALKNFALSTAFDKGMGGLVGQSNANEALRRALLRIALAEKQTDTLGGEVGLTTLLLVGPSGSGKSFAPKMLAKALKKNGINLPMQEPIQGSTLVDGEQAVRTLIGAAPSYRDSRPDGGLLFQMVRDFPQSIIVFDELDKMHEDVDKVIYEFLDSGKVINAFGKVARFTRGIAVFTANFGCEGSGGTTIRNRIGMKPEDLCDYIDRWDRHHLFKNEPGLHKQDPLVADWSEEDLRYNLFNCLKEEKLVNPQILGRVGRSNLVVFHHFSKEDLKGIANGLLISVMERYQKSHQVKVEFSGVFRDWLINFAWGKDGMAAFSYGARALLDAIESDVQQPLLEFAATHGDEARNKVWKIELDSQKNRMKVVVQ